MCRRYTGLQQPTDQRNLEVDKRKLKNKPNLGLAGINNQVKLLGTIQKLTDKRGNRGEKGTYGVPILIVAE